MAATFAFAHVQTTPMAERVDYKRAVYDVTVAGTYTTGGDSFVPPGIGTVDEVVIHSLPTDGTLAYPAAYLPATAKMKFFETGSANAGLAEKGSAESMASVTFRVTIVGKP